MLHFVIDFTTKLVDQEQYLTQIENVIWYLNYMAHLKNQSFSEGTYVISDNTSRIYDFLINYVRLVNPSVQGTIDDIANTHTNNFYADSRLSSHFPIEQKTYRHYGIDIRHTDPSKATSAYLPQNKRHILFGKTANNLIFIKPEDNGIYYGDVPYHAANFIVAQTRKLSAGLKNYLEGTFAQMVPDTLIYYIGTDDDPTWRKERIPQDFLTSALAILQSSNMEKAQINATMYILVTRGIHGAAELIQTKKHDQTVKLSQEQKNRLFTLLDQFKQEQGLDYRRTRYGREVIFTATDILNNCRSSVPTDTAPSK